MPTYRNDGKNVFIVERSDGVAVPVGPGESVATLETVTVSGFTQTDSKPAATRSKDGNELVVKVSLVSNESGVVADYQITEEDAGFDYWRHGYQLADIWVTTPAASYPTASGGVSIVDELGVEFAAGIVPPLAASGVYAAHGPLITGRLVGSKLTVSVSSSIGSAVVGFDLYLRLTKK